VRESNVVVTAPDTVEEELRNGNSATVRVARKAGKMKDLLKP
jgi:hypothetical protein